MRNVLLAAWQEFKATAMTKAFFFGVIVLPIAFYGILFGAAAAGLFEKSEEPLVGAVAVVDASENDAIYTALAARFSPEGQAEEQARRKAQVREGAEAMSRLPGAEQTTQMAEEMVKQAEADLDLQLLPDDADLEAQKQRVREGELLALIELGPHTLENPAPEPQTGDEEQTDPGASQPAEQPAGDAAAQPAEPEGRRPNTFNIFFNENVKASDRERLRDTARESVVDVRFARADLDRDEIGRMFDRPTAITRAVTETGETESSDALLKLIPLVFMILLFIAIFTGAQYLMMSTIEEKSSRVMEVLLSAASSMQLMTGKIIGQCLVGLAVVLLYGGAGFAAFIQFFDPGLITPGMLAWQVFYFLTGYAMIAAIFAAVGAAVTDIKEAQALQGPVIGGLFLVFYVMGFLGWFNPQSIYLDVLTFIPPFAPLAMSIRIGQVGDPVPAWQLITTTVICLAGAWTFIWAAAKIFRVGSLMYGKPPSIPTLLKWIRQA